jgi:hypothetical protein
LYEFQKFVQHDFAKSFAFERARSRSIRAGARGSARRRAAMARAMQRSIAPLQRELVDASAMKRA